MSVTFQSIVGDNSHKSNLFKYVGVIASILLVVFPLSINVMHNVHGVVIAMSLILIGILYYTDNKIVALDQNEKYFIASIIFMILTVVSVSVYAGIDEVIVKKLFKYTYLILIIPVYFLFRIIKVNYSLLWYGLFVGAVISGMYGMNQIIYPPFFDVVYTPRARGVTNPIIYGDFALLMGVMCLAGIGWFKSRANWQVILPVFAFSMGLLSSVISQSRGGWLAIPFFMVIFLWGANASKYIKASGVVLVLIGMVFVYLSPQTGVEARLNESITSIEMYLYNDTDSKNHLTTIGIRLEAWKAAWLVFLDNPLIGVGWGHFQENAKIYVEDNQLHKSALLFAHPHNQFLAVMASGGIIATIAIFFLFFIPLRVFYRACKSAEASIEIHRIGLAGILFIIGFVVFNLSESFLERSRTVSFFIFYLAVLMAGIRERDRETGHG